MRGIDIGIIVEQAAGEGNRENSFLPRGKTIVDRNWCVVDGRNGEIDGCRRGAAFAI